MTRSPWKVAVCIVLWTAVPARADDASAGSGRMLSLSEALALAPKQSYAVRRARAATDIGHGERSEAKWRLLPSVTAGVGLWRIDGATQSSSTGEFDQATYSTANPYLRVGYGLNPAVAYYRFDEASARVDALDAGADVVDGEIRLRVIDQYFAVARAYSSRDVAAQALADSRKLLRIAQVLERQGAGKGDDVARAKNSFARAEKNVVNAERAHVTASIALAMTIDLDVSALIEPAAADLGLPAGVQDDLDVDALAADALRRRPETKAVAAEIHVERANRRAAWADLLAPEIELYVEQGWLGADLGAVDSRRDYGVFVSWTFSLSGLARVSTAEARIRERELAAEQTRQTIRAEVTLAAEEVRLARKSLRPAREAVQAAADALRISRVRFENGDALVLEVLEAQRDLELARLEEVEAITEYNRANSRRVVVTAE